jgi:hypothetical protein
MAFDLSGLFSAGAKGAVAGAALGPVGAIGGGLLSIGVQMAPQIGRWLNGDEGGEVAVQVRNMVAQAAGTSDPDVAASALAENPEKTTELQLALARLAAEREDRWSRAQLERLKYDLSSEMDARATTVALVKERHPLAYGAALVTIVLLSAFIYVIVANPPMDEGMKETLKVLTVAAASYWIGSSRGSAAKDTPVRSTDSGAR